MPARRSNRPSTDRARISTVATFEHAKEILKRYFGHDGFRPEQERTIRAMMGKLNILAIKSIGADKSLINQGPPSRSTTPPSFHYQSG